MFSFFCASFNSELRNKPKCFETTSKTPPNQPLKHHQVTLRRPLHCWSHYDPNVVQPPHLSLTRHSPSPSSTTYRGMCCCLVEFFMIVWFGNHGLLLFRNERRFSS
ncbi:hypothetical protein RYX36_000201 [Vicia faba]